MRMPSTFLWRMGLWSGLMLYLFVDLVWLRGPLKRQVERLQGIPENQATYENPSGIVATVFGQPILLSQVDYKVDELLYRSGRSRKDIDAPTRVELRHTAVRDLCDNYLLRIKTGLNKDDHPISDEQITAAMQQFASRFSSPAELQETMKNFGFEGEKELRFRIAAQLQQDHYLETMIAPAIAVSEKEARTWYDKNETKITLPARAMVSHIFIDSLTHSAQQAQEILQPALTTILQDPSQFPILAKQISLDPRSKDAGGQVGWLQPDRCHPLPAKQLFSMKAGECAILHSNIGWHLVRIERTLPPSTPEFSEVKAEITAALEAERRPRAIAAYLQQLRHRHHGQIQIDFDLLKLPWSQ